jgi:hypothetical protein
VATLLTWVFRLLMTFMGLAFLLGLVAALGIYIVWATLRWLLTGRKPQVVMVWQQFNNLRKGARWGGQPGFDAGHEAQRQGDIVDVEVREIRPDTPHDKRLQ